MQFLKQSTTAVLRIGPFVDAADGFTAETGLSIAQADIQISKTGGGFAQTSDATPTTTHDADGWYQCPLTIADTGTPGALDLEIAMGGARPVSRQFSVLPAPIYEMLIAGDGAFIRDATWAAILTGATYNQPTSAGRFLREIQELHRYANRCIWIDTVNGAAGSTPYENGTVDNPVDNMVDLNLLAAATGIGRFDVAPGSSITFAAAQEDQVFMGRRWMLALGGQSISGTSIYGARISGVATGASEPFFEGCHVDTATLPPSHLCRCGLGATVTAVSAGLFMFEACHSQVAGVSAPVFDFGAGLGASDLNFRSYSGGIEIRNMGAGAGAYKMSLEGFGQLIIASSCSSPSTVAIRGHFTVTDNAAGAVTLSDYARYPAEPPSTTKTFP